MIKHNYGTFDLSQGMQIQMMILKGVIKNLPGHVYNKLILFTHKGM